MSERGSAGPGREFLYFAGIVLAVSLGLCLIGYWPTRRLGGDAALWAMPFAVAVTAVGSIVGGLPVLLARSSGDVKPHIVLVSMLVRLFVVVALAALVLLSASFALTPFLLWLAVGYIALLVVDTGYAMRLSDSL